MSTWPFRLLRWFALHHREMPWRSRVTPYRVWISEVMLQQTQVDTVVPYFERFIDRFPTVRSLADADLQDVLKVWEGLGYYARARNLHRTARALVSEHGGSLPAAYDALRKLPGLGPYTAAAVASIAFGEAVPVVDGNVLRVFARFFGLEEDTRRTRTRTLVRDRLLPIIQEVCDVPGYQAGETSFEMQPSLVRDRAHGRVAKRSSNPAGDFNQSIMELGALVCQRTPRCVSCPLRDDCVAHRTGRTHELPLRSTRPRTPHYDVAVGVIWREGRLLIGRRPTDAMLGGLWELPGGKRHEGEALEETARREIREETDLDVRVGEVYTTVKHTYTHFKITLTAFRCTPITPPTVPPTPHATEELRWVTLDELDAYPFPRASLKVLEHVGRAERTREAGKPG